MSDVKITVDGKEWSESEILKYRLERAEEAIAFFKKQLGVDGMRPLFEENTKEMTDKFLKAVEESDGEYAEARVEFDVPGVKAEDYLNFFNSMGKGDVPMINSHPEHYYLVPSGDGVHMELCEAIGEAPPFRCLNVHVADPGMTPVPYDPDADAYMPAVISSMDGELLGIYAMHQFFNTEDGLHAVADCFYPAKIDPAIIEGHKRHLVVEFGSWFDALLEYQKAQSKENDA